MREYMINAAAAAAAKHTALLASINNGTSPAPRFANATRT